MADLTPHYGSPFMAALRVLGFASLTLAMVPIHLIYTRLYPQDPFRISIFFYRQLLKVLGFQVRVHGAQATKRPILFVANHSSYLDVPVLGSLIPAGFVAKAEVAKWPFFGFMAKIQNTVFIERRVSRVHDQRQGLRNILDKGQNLVLFPEGTSSDGLAVLPFKSSLFSVMGEQGTGFLPLTVQPISIVCTQLDGMPLTRSLRSFYSWYGDMTLVGHLWDVFKFGRFTIDVTFHAAVTPETFANRKELAAYCQEQVGRGIEISVTGRRDRVMDTHGVKAAAH